MPVITQPVPFFADLDGSPLDNGRVYFGTAGGNPVTSPVTVYWDDAQTQPVAQPAQTMNGMIYRSGAPAAVYASVPLSMLVQNSAGAQVLYAASVSTIDSTLRADLAAANGSSLVSFTQGAAGAATRTLQNRGREVIMSSDFSGDAYTRITAAIAHAKTHVAPYLVIEPGSLNIGDNTLIFDVPNGTRITFLGTITSTATNKTAIQIGKTSGNTFWLSVEGIKIARSSNDYTGSSVGVELLNLAWCAVDIRQVTGFRIGVMGHGNGFGTTYNTITLGQLHDNRTNMVIRVTNPAGGGYCNECEWIGGSFNHTTSYDVVTYNGVNLDIEYNATNQPNNHLFLGPSFEDAHPTSANTVAAIMQGANNVLVHPRLERIFSPTTYQIQFTSNATECGIAGDGFSMLNSNISDLGTNTKYATREGQVLSYQTPATAGKQVMSLRSTTTSNATLLAFLDAAGSQVGSVTGNGLLTIANITATNLVTAANDAAAAGLGCPLNGFYVNSATGYVAKRIV